MNRNEILEALLLKETGRTFAGGPIWDEIERAASGAPEEGEQWITGQDDPIEKWEYYVDIKRTYDEEFDQWETNISLEEIKITDAKTNKTVYVQVKGATL